MSKQIEANAAFQLDQIRQAEAEVTRLIATAREKAKIAENEALEEIKKIKSQAKQTGTKEGQIQVNDIISKAKEEAELIIAQSCSQADRFKQVSQSYIDEVVKHAVNIVIGVKEIEIEQ